MSDALAWALLGALCTGLRDEAGSVGDRLIADAARGAADLAGERSDWYAALDAYTAAKRRLGAALGARSEVADSYPTMGAFWADAEAQRLGESTGTFWDTYEHGGRRRLEALFARSYSSDEAVLVNSGMSAVHVALASARLRPGDVVLTHTRSYFETTELLEEVYAPAGVRVVRVDATEPGALAQAASAERPAVVLVETALNALSCRAPDFDGWTEDLDPLVVVDNSVLSHALDFPAVERTTRARRLLVVESGIKYATHDCSAGVVYGRSDAVGPARDLARRTGQLLQGKAFHHIRPAEVETLRERLALHSARNRTFTEHLVGCEIATIDRATREQPGSLPAAVHRAGPGSLVFVRAGGLVDDAYGDVVDDWAQGARAAGMRLDVRAGFGWDATSARSYRSTFLNQPDAPSFLRVSTGIGPEEEVVRLAGALSAAVSTRAGRPTSAR